MKINDVAYKFLRNFILISSLVYFIYFISENSDYFKTLNNFNFQIILIILFLKFLNVFFLSNINQNILKNLKIDLKNVESLDLVVKNTLGNLSSPFKLGSGYKVSYLSKKYKFKFTEYIFWTTFFSLINLYPLYSIFLGYSLITGNKIILNNLIYFLTVYIPIFLIIYLQNKNKYLNKYPYLKSFKYFSKNNISIQISNILFFISNSLIVYLILENLTINASLYSATAYSFLSSFVNLINLTPGNIGVKEGLIILFDNIHGISFEIVVIASVIERFFSLVTLFIFQLILKRKTENI